MRSPETIREIKETLPKKEVAFAFIKPRFLDEVGKIEEIIKNSGLEIIYKDKIRLGEEAVDYIYGDLKNSHFYPAMKKHLSENDVIVLMVGGKGHEAQSVLSKLKKEEGKDGVLREKFRKEQKLSPEEYSLWSRGEHPDQEKMSIMITQGNVIHTADCVEDALKSLNIILGDKFNEMKKKGNLPAELWELFEENDNK